MAENIIKDFMRRQTSPITIGVPQSRNTSSQEIRAVSQPLTAPQQPAPQETKKAGRPRTFENRARITIYLPEEVKDTIIRIQHKTFKPSINEVMIEAVRDLLEKYGFKFPEQQ